MTPGESDPTRPLSDDDVRRMLAAAGAAEAMPPAVAERLDGVLASLASERDEPARPGRARRGRVLLAAAAVVVAGVALGSTLPGPGESEGGDASTAGGGSEGQVDRTAPSTGPRAAGSLGQRIETGRVPARLRSGRLAADVLAVLATMRPVDSAPLASSSRRCLPPTLAPQQLWAPARYDGRRVVLVTGDPDRARVPVTVYSCGGEVLARTTVAPD